MKSSMAVRNSDHLQKRETEAPPSGMPRTTKRNQTRQQNKTTMNDMNSMNSSPFCQGMQGAGMVMYMDGRLPLSY